MKIGIVGFGYWGKIILNNLRELGYNDIVICEKQPIDWDSIGSKYKIVKDYSQLKCDKVFVLTPATMHFDICEHFLKQGIDVFCEKPLDQSSAKCKKLFSIAKKHGAILFVDWLFTFNPAVHKIKSLIKEWGKPTNIIANRMNYGPVRHDVNARWDLASHDVSIACYLLDETPHTTQWLDFKRDATSEQEDSVVGILSFENTCVQINASWAYNTKNRLYIFEFKEGFLYWDDTTKTIIWGTESLEVDKTSPLHNSISSFFSRHSVSDPTLEITSILIN
jgi:predicted dehydrogenase